MPYISHRRPNAIPVGAHPRRGVSDSSPRRRRADRGPRCAPRSNPIVGTGVAEPCEVAPVGVEYLVRAARVTDIDRLVALSDDAGAIGRGDEPARRGRSPAPARLPAAGQHRRRRSAARRRRRRGPRAPSVRSSRRLRRHRSTSWSSTRSTTPTAITEALLEELLRSASNKGCTVVEAERPDDPAALDALAADGLRRSRSAHLTNRGRGGSRRASHDMNVPRRAA